MAYRLMASGPSGDRSAGEAYERPMAIRMAEQLARTDPGEDLTTYRVVDWRENVIFEVSNDGQPGKELR